MQALDNLVRIGQLKPEPADAKEFAGLLGSAKARLRDARHAQLAIESRFDLAYNAAHALALAALRWHGYRSDKRYTVFQCTAHTLGLGPEVWRVLTLCHDRRNRAEYEGLVEVDEQLVRDLLAATDQLLAAVDTLQSLK
ncbi:hypothetical protein GALL_480490 [mine drainage metagenome]|uniref:HEPN domain-containing protein n=1 Tax=mine drainage metagenome TaxID=410659 RepID=A0A1J5PGK3_9ZZZZ